MPSRATARVATTIRRIALPGSYIVRVEIALALLIPTWVTPSWKGAFHGVGGVENPKNLQNSPLSAIVLE
jgi:hypothetical protein